VWFVWTHQEHLVLECAQKQKFLTFGCKQIEHDLLHRKLGIFLCSEMRRPLGRGLNHIPDIK
ncbi:MAG: hypothetical protein AABX12_03340, partial [Nanoarchaeota archaeon]